jgi:prevent-host-death family protein
MDEVGLRELRQNASDLVRRAEAGEVLTITVAGRPAATIGPLAPHSWRQWDEVQAVFERPVDPAWERDQVLLGGPALDPWAPGPWAPG